MLSYAWVGGTQMEEKADRQLCDEIRQTGLDVCCEEFDIPFFKSDEVCPDAGWRVPCVPVRFSGTTDEAGILAPFACVGDAKSEELVHARGKMVLCQEMLAVERWKNLIERRGL